MYILGIETSCDETAAAVIKFDEKFENIEVLSNIVASQIEIHKKYGGVIPEIAAREHVSKILPTIDEAISKANIKPHEIDSIAITKGPGLITSLMSGIETAKSLSFVWKKPIIEVNHIEGHIYSNYIENKEKIKLPAVILTVSGGHTNLVLMNKDYSLKKIGETLDDAAGEAFDKGAKMMGLGYPGGPQIAKKAHEYQENNFKNEGEEEIRLPKPMINSKNLDFSFSGLKTALLYQLKKDNNWKERIPEYCFRYQEAITTVLIKKTIQAAEKYQVKSIMLSGGVSANKFLREKMKEEIEKKLPNIFFYTPNLEYTTDNAAMIGVAGIIKQERNSKSFKKFFEVKVDPNWGFIED